MSISGLDHVQLAMPQGRENDADAFYRDLLGFDIVPKPAPDSALAPCEPGYPARGRSLAGERLSSLRSLVAAGARAIAANEAERSELARSERPWRRYPAPQRATHEQVPFGNRIELIAR